MYGQGENDRLALNRGGGGFRQWGRKGVGSVSHARDMKDRIREKSVNSLKKGGGKKERDSPGGGGGKAKRYPSSMSRAVNRKELCDDPCRKKPQEDAWRGKVGADFLPLMKNGASGRKKRRRVKKV